MREALIFAQAHCLYFPQQLSVGDVVDAYIERGMLGRARVAASCYPHEYRRDRAREKVVRAYLDKRMFAQMQEVAEDMEDDTSQSCSLEHVIKACIADDMLAQAWRAAMAIRENHSRSYSLQRLVQVCVNENRLGAAQKIAKSIRYRKPKDKLGIYFVNGGSRLLTQGHPAARRAEFEEREECKRIQGEASECVVKAYVARGMFAKAQDVANAVHNPILKGELLKRARLEL